MNIIMLNTSLILIQRIFLRLINVQIESSEYNAYILLIRGLFKVREYYIEARLNKLPAMKVRDATKAFLKKAYVRKQ